MSLHLVAYVDDILYISRNAQRMEEIKNGLARFFELKDLGQARYCLGIEIQQAHGEIKLSQGTCYRKYTRDLLKKFNMNESKQVNTPAESKVELPEGCHREKKDQKEKPYRELIGSLLYLAVATRPDLSFTVNRLAQFNESYQQIHWSAAKRVLRYLQGTSEYGLVYKRDGEKILGYTDADYANYVIDRKSYSGYVFKLSGAAVSWRSQKQRPVVLSSTEAEYVALNEAAKEAMYLRGLMGELGLDKMQDIVVSTTNQGAKSLAEHSVYRSRTKHIEVKWHYVRNLLNEKLIKLNYLPTEIMPADILTKPLPGPAHYRGLKQLGVSE